jgi:flagellar basal body-associated protein FliL
MEKKTKAPAAKPAKKSSGISPIIVIPILMALAFAIHYVIFFTSKL